MGAFPRQFDEAYIVSDLHLGGPAGFQIFDQGERLARFIGTIASADRSAANVVLVLNGDVIDGLAEAMGTRRFVALDEATATTMVARVMDDPAFKPVFDALADYVARPGRELVIVVGNHDIELALPAVEELLRQRLAGDNLERRARLTFSTHGAGTTFRIGGARVFCTHGNEIDEWNNVDHGRLSELANAQNAGRRIDEARWEPNLGTRFVIEAMNPIKARYPFIDLLKPEVASAAAVLAVLDASLLRSLDVHLMGVLRSGQASRARALDLLGPMVTGTDGATADRPSPSTDALIAELLGPNLRATPVVSAASAEDAALVAAARLSEEPLDDAAWEDETLGPSLRTVVRVVSGIADFVQSRVGALEPAEGLRRALQDWLGEPGTDEFNVPGDKQFEALGPRVGPDVDIVVAGHTHKARAMSYDDGRLFFNSGSWIRQLRIPPELLNDEAAFAEQVWKLLQQTTVQKLSDTPVGTGQANPLAVDRTHAVHLWSENGTTWGEVVRVTSDPDGAVRVEPEKATKLAARR